MTPGGTILIGGDPMMNHSDWCQLQTYKHFSGSFNTSLHLPLWLALHVTLVYIVYKHFLL